MAKTSKCSGKNIIVEDSKCAQCVHLRRLLIPEMKTCFSLKCAAADKYMKTPRKSCTMFEPETWEKFLDIGDEDEN
ncbi:hypothetical protein [Seleniivibrio sp.]|uniref:hypothetical protein n=1 Tax=Seleniivibrio sp. TaxID=2898801 RepID=UPI0025FAC20D|nr:hypothetical protein [Seleniivibrio sp.]MCD8554238.1 hypothetical protein [Seleniivibrio sp.]